MPFYSPLRYPGGKGKIAKFFHQVIEDNDLLDGTYVEPYAGGASVALSLLFNEYVSNIVINDYDRSIYAFWRSVLSYTDELCKRIEAVRVNTKTWKMCKEIQRKKKRSKILDLGFSTFFLNRTNHSGIINAGIIGGKSQKGKWKIDARFNKENLISRIRAIGEYKDRIKIHNLDAQFLLQKLAPSFNKKTFCYFDPPYYEKGEELYVNYYTHEDHMQIAKRIKKLKQTKWIVSYDNQQEIKNMYTGCKRIEYNLNYSVRKPTIGTEVMFFNRGLKMPPKTLAILKPHAVAQA